MKTIFDVLVVYTEPEFQRRTANAPAEYSYVYADVEALSPDDAVRIALEDFRRTARLSRVSWRRNVERITVHGVESRTGGRPAS